MLLVCLNLLLGCLGNNMKYVCHEKLFGGTSFSSSGKSMLHQAFPVYFTARRTKFPYPSHYPDLTSQHACVGASKGDIFHNHALTKYTATMGKHHIYYVQHNVTLLEGCLKTSNLNGPFSVMAVTSSIMVQWDFVANIYFLR
jgi:hypothetical protein